MIIETIAVVALWKAKRTVSRGVRKVVTEVATEVVGQSAGKAVGIVAGIAASGVLGGYGEVLEGVAALADLSDAADTLNM